MRRRKLEHEKKLRTRTFVKTEIDAVVVLLDNLHTVGKHLRRKKMKEKAKKEKKEEKEMILARTFRVSIALNIPVWFERL
jgi:hypothetical protein